jgi:hypothetical protein
MGLLKVTVTSVLVATPVTARLLAKGAVADTLGGWDVMGPEPKMGSLLPPHAVMKKTLARASDQGALPLQSLNVRIKRLQSQFSAMSEVVYRFGQCFRLCAAWGRPHGMWPMDRLFSLCEGRNGFRAVRHSGLAW